MVKRKVHGPGNRSLRAVLCTCVAAAFVFTGINAFALTGKLGDSGTISVDTTLNYDVGWRADSMDPQWMTTGNSNFESGDLINNMVSVLV